MQVEACALPCVLGYRHILNEMKKKNCKNTLNLIKKKKRKTLQGSK